MKSKQLYHTHISKPVRHALFSSHRCRVCPNDHLPVTSGSVAQHPVDRLTAILAQDPVNHLPAISVPSPPTDTSPQDV